MSNTPQTEAQRLADWLDGFHRASVHHECAAELRRLDAENQQLRTQLAKAAAEEREAFIDIVAMHGGSIQSQEPVTLRDYADSLIKAGHEFWKACRRDAGGGAVRWLSCDDGTLIVFTRGEYRDAIMGAVGGYRATEVVFEDQANDEQGGVFACAATSQPLTDEVFRPIVKAVFDAGWATCRASELVGDNAKEFAWDMYGDELTERLIAAIPPQEPVTAALRDLVAAVQKEMSPDWICSSYHPHLHSALDTAIAALREKESNK